MNNSNNNPTTGTSTNTSLGGAMSTSPDATTVAPSQPLQPTGTSTSLGSPKQPDANVAQAAKPAPLTSQTPASPPSTPGAAAPSDSDSALQPFSPSALSSSHRAQMQKLQTEMHAKIAAAKNKNDLVIVNTGNGKGKSTAAFGMLVRNLGHNRKSAVIQFVKAGDHAIQRVLQGNPLLQWHHVGNGFTWDTQNLEADIACAREGWSLALAHLADPAIRFLLLDELNIILQCRYLPVDEVIAALKTRAPGKHVVITGRNAPKELIDYADLVTEMKEIKHPFQSGTAAQPGIEF